MKIVHIVVGSACLAAIAASALVGIWAWYRDPRLRAFWWLLRAAQALLVIEAVLGGIWEISRRASGLHLIYGLVPIAVSLVAEQLRLASAQMVLDSRGFENAAAVGKLPESEQQVVVQTIIHRELGVMVLAAIVMTVLVARAAMTG
ncbi:MAG TPA: hypothetical protein VKV21_02455 [Solirubrobacteraceae bacterium]|nr:hypothetical protein [Solirubrobacteraceae bacterium]